jgi:hypothetical protein
MLEHKDFFKLFRVAKTFMGKGVLCVVRSGNDKKITIVKSSLLEPPTMTTP